MLHADTIPATFANLTVKPTLGARKFSSTQDPAELECLLRNLCVPHPIRTEPKIEFLPPSYPWHFGSCAGSPHDTYENSGENQLYPDAMIQPINGAEVFKQTLMCVSAQKSGFPEFSHRRPGSKVVDH